VVKVCGFMSLLMGDQKGEELILDCPMQAIKIFA
jgi:hypothetical protein